MASADDASSQHSRMSDAARYAYASLLCLLWKQNEFGSQPDDHQFRNETVQRLLHHLNLVKCEPTMHMLLDIENHSTEPYVQILSEEPGLETDGTLVISDALKWALKEGNYDARIRVVLSDLALLLRLSPEHFDMLEDSSVMKLMESTKDVPETKEEEELKRKKAMSKKYKKYAVIGTASVTGGVLVGVTGGLVAPLIGASLAALLGLGGAAIASTAGAAVLGSLFGAAGAGLAGYKMNKRVGDVEEFSFVRLCPGEGSRLHVTIGVPGWLPPDDDDEDEDDDKSLQDRLMMPLDCLAHSHEQYGLRYETKYLAELGQAMKAVLNMAVTVAATEVLKLTVLQGLLAAVALPQTILAMTSVIDNPWGVCCSRSAEVGAMLALALMDRASLLGRRPVTLVGVSLGARVIFYCLKELYQRGPAGKGIVQSAVLVGSPVSGSPDEWHPLLEVVAGRLVNAYSRNDWILKVIYRTSSAAYNIAGLQPIDIQHPRMINLDLSDIINGHGEYRMKATECFRAAGLRIVDMVIDEEEEEERDDEEEDEEDLSGVID